jgi:hypothetical protein
MSVTAKQIRELAAAGLTAEAIGKQLGCKPARATQTLKRSTRIGRPGGQASMTAQIHYVRRVAESAEDPLARSLASQLLKRLLELE